MQIEMTGKEDRLSPWKYAIGGYPGSGKTLLASTAPKPLFVFFRENPRIKSIADRFIPHVKVLNDDTTTVLEKMQALSVHLELVPGEFETLVIDTGDELQVAMKEARRIRNGGEFGVSDWGWLGDAYRELMTSLIDLPMRVIVLFHVKNSQEGDDGQMVREVLLQGAAKDEVAGWFDIVGALDTYEIADDQGDWETRRVLLTHSSRLYPWLKDHSGNMPRRYELSTGFVNDIDAIETVLNSTEIQVEHEVIGEISSAGPDDVSSEVEVISPKELEAHKNPDTPEINQALDTVAEVLEIAEITDASHEEQEETTVGDPDESPPRLVETVQSSLLNEDVEEDISHEEPPEQPQAPEVLCEVCGNPAPEDVVTVSKIRFKKALCREHFREQLKAE